MSKITLRCTVNCEPREASVYPMARLLDVLREEWALTGTKEGCGEGECGACGILLEGELVNSCLVPAAQAQGAEIRTIEGVGNEAGLHAVQKAFLECGGAQCGICTPGMIMAAIVLLDRNPQPTLADVQKGLSGNLCRCTGYRKICESVLKAAIA